MNDSLEPIIGNSSYSGPGGFRSDFGNTLYNRSTDMNSNYGTFTNNYMNMSSFSPEPDFSFPVENFVQPTHNDQYSSQKSQKVSQNTSSGFEEFMDQPPEKAGLGTTILLFFFFVFTFVVSGVWVSVYEYIFINYILRGTAPRIQEQTISAIVGTLILISLLWIFEIPISVLE